jgi:hypothetical protein
MKKAGPRARSKLLFVAVRTGQRETPVKYDPPPKNSSGLLRFRLQRALGAHCFDGSEAHANIDAALNGANLSPSRRIKLKQRIEVVAKLVEEGEIP